jgi:thermostable 8-oxoguanine DNA glycosylase
MSTKSERLRDACEHAVKAFRKLNDSDFDEIISKLEYCIGSYNFDKNPAGLVEYGYKAHELLKAVKKNYPRKVSKEVLNDLEEGLA